MDPGDRPPPEEAQDRRRRWAAEDVELAEGDEAETLEKRIGRLAKRRGEVVGAERDPRALDLSDPSPESAGDRDARVNDEAEIDRELGEG
jgi:hypothetical protein